MCKAVISDNLQGARPLIQILLGNWGGEAEVSLKLEAEVSCSSKQSAYHRGTSWGDSF